MAYKTVANPSVEEAVVCELDQRVVDLSREHFASFGDPWGDPRARLIVRDAFGYLEENPGQCDVIISDTTDPIGMAERLFSDEFQKFIVRALVPGGEAATQCEQPFFDTELIKQIHRSAKTLTKNPAYYYAHIPTYPGGGIGFMYVSDTPWQKGLQTPYPKGGNQYLNPEVHQAAFALPEFFRKAFLPSNEQELQWFEEGTDHKKCGDFASRLFKEVERINNDL